MRVEVSFVSSDDVLRQKISAKPAAELDVFAANTAEMHYINERLVVPLRLGQISPNTPRTSYPVFASCRAFRESPIWVRPMEYRTPIRKWG